MNIQQEQDFSSEDIKRITSVALALCVTAIGSFFVYGGIMFALASLSIFLVWILFIASITSVLTHKILQWGFSNIRNKRLWFFAGLMIVVAILLMFFLLNFSPSFTTFMADF